VFARRGVGDRRSALVGVGKDAVSTNQCKKWLRGKKAFAHPTVKGSVTKGVTNTRQGWLKPDVGLTEGDEDDEGELLTARFNRVSVAPARRWEASFQPHHA
jgi:hypothetical protein